MAAQTIKIFLILLMLSIGCCQLIGGSDEIEIIIRRSNPTKNAVWDCIQSNWLFSLKNKASGLCLSAVSSSDSRMQLRSKECDGSDANQLFVGSARNTDYHTYLMRNSGTDKCVHVYTSDGTYYTTLADCQYTWTSQLWKDYQQYGDYRQILSYAGDDARCLTTNTQNPNVADDGVPYAPWCADSDIQKWVTWC